MNEMYAIFFTTQVPAIQIAVPRGKSVNAKFYKTKVFRKLNKSFKSEECLHSIPKKTMIMPSKIACG